MTCWPEFPLQPGPSSLLLFTEELFKSICFYFLVFPLPLEPTLTTWSFHHQSCLFKVTRHLHVVESRRPHSVSLTPDSQEQQPSYSLIHPSRPPRSTFPSAFWTPQLPDVTPPSLAVVPSFNCSPPWPTTTGVLKGSVPWPHLFPHHPHHLYNFCPPHSVSSMRAGIFAILITAPSSGIERSKTEKLSMIVCWMGGEWLDGSFGIF